MFVVRPTPHGGRHGPSAQPPRDSPATRRQPEKRPAPSDEQECGCRGRGARWTRATARPRAKLQRASVLLRELGARGKPTCPREAARAPQSVLVHPRTYTQRRPGRKPSHCAPQPAKSTGRDCAHRPCGHAASRERVAEIPPSLPEISGRAACEEETSLMDICPGGQTSESLGSSSGGARQSGNPPGAAVATG